MADRSSTEGSAALPGRIFCVAPWSGAVALVSVVEGNGSFNGLTVRAGRPWASSLRRPSVRTRRAAQTAWPFAIRADETLPGDLAPGITLADEAVAAGADSLVFYEHSDPTTAMQVRKSGSDVVIRP